MAGTSSCPGLAGLLSEMLQIPVQPFEPLGAVAGSRRRRDVGSEQAYAVALGMALRSLADG
jgi:Tfp pilus assembly PilM family ATPase